ncbi:hypothetical protein F4823DRAFT_189502 [Ustulina deusta]|nr:hypothetical protein F4823DRAFT_189502 [Ustulina deusta]
MSYARGPLRTLQLATVLAIASAASIRANWVLERADTCTANYEKCTEVAGLPANFCCATGSTCKVLAGATTVLCCPGGSDCSTIEIISCNVSLQDPIAHPQAAVKTTELDGTLPACGKGCCPFGYHCDTSNANCVIDEDQSQKPSTTSSVPSATSSAQPSSTTSTGQVSTNTTAAAAVGTDATPAPPTETPSSVAASTRNTAAIVGGVVGGLFALALIIAGLWWLRHKRNKAAAEREKRDTTESFGNMISAPIPHADYHTQRLDFLAKAQSSSVSSSPTPGTQGPFPPSSPYSVFAFRPGSEMTDRPRSYHASAEIGGLRNLTDRYSSGSVANPFTPRGERLNSGGSESINIFADPSTVGTPSIYNRRDTTWTEFQHHADQQGIDSPVRRR